MSEREPYDGARTYPLYDADFIESMEQEHGQWDSRGHCVVCFVRHPCDPYLLASSARSEHAARLEAEARVERLEAFVEKIESWVLDEAVGFEEDSSGYARAAYDVSHMLSRAALETGGEG